jgi:hypothetical protein
MASIMRRVGGGGLAVATSLSQHEYCASIHFQYLYRGRVRHAGCLQYTEIRNRSRSHDVGERLNILARRRHLSAPKRASTWRRVRAC